MRDKTDKLIITGHKVICTFNNRQFMTVENIPEDVIQRKIKKMKDKRKDK